MMKDKTRIDAARASSHHQAIDSSEAHCGCDAPALMHRA
jgi:hypothetical protein